MSKDVLDTMDKKILGVLVQDARTPVSHIAKEIRLSRQMVTQRIQKMQQQNTIKCFSARINYEKLGLYHAEAWFSFRGFSGETKQAIIEYFVKHPHTRWVGDVLGVYHLRVTFIASNHTHLEVILSEVFEQWGSLVDDYELNTIVGISKHHSTQLTKGEWSRLERVTEQNPRVELDEVDIRLLELLSFDGRASFRDLSDEVGLTLEAVRVRVRNLEKRGVIIHYSTSVHHRHLDRQWMILSVRLGHLDASLKAAVAEFTRARPFGANSYFLLGSWHYHITINADSMSEVQEAVTAFYDTFSTHVRSVQPSQVVDSYKYPGVARGLFDVLRDRLE